MVEMRWLQRPGPFQQPDSKLVYMEKVLQYRQFRTHRIEGGKAIELADWSDDYGWSEWIDVPTQKG